MRVYDVYKEAENAVDKIVIIPKRNDIHEEEFFEEYDEDSAIVIDNGSWEGNAVSHAIIDFDVLDYMYVHDAIYTLYMHVDENTYSGIYEYAKIGNKHDSEKVAIPQVEEPKTNSEISDEHLKSLIREVVREEFNLFLKKLGSVTL